MRPRQPDVVVPVAAVRRGRGAGLAGGGRRPARDGVLAAGCAAHAGAAGGRSRRRARRAGRRRAGGRGGARLGRGGVAGLGGAAPRPGFGSRAGQHGRAPAVGIVGARADPAGPDTGAAARGVRDDPGVRAGGDGAVASPAAHGRARGVRGAVRVSAAAAGGRGVRRGHPARPRARERRDRGRDRRGGPQARRRAGAAAVGPSRPGVLRPLPARPAGPPAARGRAALREGVASRAGGRPGGGGARVGVDHRARSRTPRPGFRRAAQSSDRFGRRCRSSRGRLRGTGAVDGAGGAGRRPLPRRRVTWQGGEAEAQRIAAR